MKIVEEARKQKILKAGGDPSKTGAPAVTGNAQAPVVKPAPAPDTKPAAPKTPPPPPEEPSLMSKINDYIPYIGGGLLVVLIVAMVLKKKKKEE